MTSQQHGTNAMEKLSQVLWQERALLESLMFKLDVEQLILSSGRTRWLGRTAQEVESVVSVLRETELVRAVAADEAAAAIGLTANPSLRALAEAIDDPWRTIFNDHREAFLQASKEIAALAETNKELLTQGLRSARETLLSMGESAEGYGQDGVAVLSIPDRGLVDRSL